MIPLQYASEYNEIPKMDLVVMQDCGHAPYVEKPIEFNEIILRFLIGNK
jgi:pimeloyl-ACP methyl ester carboxylesterase